MPHALRLILCLFLFGIASIGNTIHANDSSFNAPFANEAPQTDPASVDLISENQNVQLGTPFWVAVRLKMDDHWHAYWKNPGDAGMAPVINWHLPEGFAVNSLLWPTPQRFTVDTAVGFGYEKELILLAEITSPTTHQGSVDIHADVRWVVCSDSTCLPGEGQVSLSLPTTDATPIADAKEAETFTKARALIPQKSNQVSAQRKSSLIELEFDEEDNLEGVDFFPESQTAINYKAATLLPQTDNSHHYVAILNEAEAAATLQGVLVVHTSKGDHSYEIDTPIAAGAESDEIVSMLMPPNKDEVGLLAGPIDENISDNYAFEGGLALAIAFAFIGGLILNLMPCVMPVISFKILSFVKLANQSRKLIFQHGIAFSAGVLLSFWVLAGMLLILQAYGRSVGWGFQLQEPLFVAILAALLFIFGLSLFGLFEIGTSLIAAAGQVQQMPGKRNELISSFLSGILATAVATPCTGPFLGSAVGFAVTLPAFQALMIFTSLGLGMSLPYLALAAFPALLRFMPKPGPWMVTFKEVMGFLMIGTVVWLVWVFGAQTNSFAIALLLAGFFLLAIAGWIYGRWCTPLRRKLTRMISMVITAAFFASASYAIVLSASSWADAMGTASSARNFDVSDAGETWEEFSPERVAELRSQGIPVFVDFTAKWCLICQANHLVLSKDEVSEKFGSLKVVRMKADWTKNDAVIAAELRKFGRNSVPLYILYGSDPGKGPEILPQVLTPDVVLNALERVEKAL